MANGVSQNAGTGEQQWDRWHELTMKMAKARPTPRTMP
jgi:hypothetical protein